MADMQQFIEAETKPLETVPAPGIEAAPVAGRLKDTDYETMKLKLSGLSVRAIAEKLGIDRTTVYRRIEKVTSEFLESLEGKSSLNIIGSELQKIENIFNLAMQNYERATTERGRDAALNTARKASNDAMRIYLETGIVDRAPERLYQTVFSMKPADLKSEEGENISHEEAVKTLIEKMQKGRRLS